MSFLTRDFFIKLLSHPLTVFSLLSSLNFVPIIVCKHPGNINLQPLGGSCNILGRVPAV